MKNKNFSKKLSLNKVTVTHLNEKEALAVNGGTRADFSDYVGCRTEVTYCFTQCVTNCETKLCCETNGCTYKPTLCSCPYPCESVNPCDP